MITSLANPKFLFILSWCMWVFIVLKNCLYYVLSNFVIKDIDDLIQKDKNMILCSPVIIPLPFLDPLTNPS